MLKQLYIKNFTLIDELNINFHPGFSVITGETGAGKSIILGAIALLLGQRAGSKSLKEGASKCVVEAHFDLSRYQMESFFESNDIDFDPKDCIIRRELTAAGKSRAFINDTPVQLSLMRILGEQLIDIHSQHQNLMLQKEDFQLGVVDIIAQDDKELSSYKKNYQLYRQKIEELDQLRTDIEQSKKDEEYLRFQLSELQQAHLEAGLQEQLEQESDTLSHSEEIKTALFTADHLLSSDEGGIVEHIKSATQELQAIEKVFPTIKELAERLASVHIEVKDIAQEVSSDMENIDFDPQRLVHINEQLDKIYTLEKKFHADTMEELMEMQQSIEKKLNHLSNSDDELRDLQIEADKLLETCKKQAEAITQLRKKAAKTIEKEMRDRLIPMGIPYVRFAVDFKSSNDLQLNGADKIQFMFSANQSTDLQPISQVASGGEIARVMLSLKAMVSGTVKLPTIIFDEIDTGVSGKIAQKMAFIMDEMGRHNRQVISITHLPQIAALGDNHYKVYKEETPQGTSSHMQQLSEDERIKEIAQMLSGDNISEAAISNAKDLLNQKHAPSVSLKKKP